MIRAWLVDAAWDASNRLTHGRTYDEQRLSADSGLVYLPTQDLPAGYSNEPESGFAEGDWIPRIEMELLEMPGDPAVAAELLTLVRGRLVAWDPFAQREGGARRAYAAAASP